ncbi:hypothetical protein BMETH_1375_0 [methanotrophic bacterial endosymbiont of Bathymodiolus sp.]|nr:hypothetical protein BMETH_1375_0 [methanotrophic bacterial endosymbiont of Bathymodiolus sp.]
MATTSPATGLNKSDAALTDSTTAHCSSTANTRPTSGNSM